MINICVAHFLEAKVLIEHFGLIEQKKTPFKIYAKDSLQLIISGQGSSLAAAAVAYLGAFATSYQAWLNFGTAGHRSLPIGSCILASNVGNWYPRYLGPPTIPYCAVSTHHSPDLNYSDDYASDMEATGFMQAALLFSSLELIGVIKIISDNAAMPFDLSDKKSLENLMLVALPYIKTHITYLTTLLESLPKPNFCYSTQFIEQKYSLSVTEQYTLKRLIKTLSYQPQRIDLDTLAQQTANKKELFRQLESIIRECHD